MCRFPILLTLAAALLGPALRAQTTDTPLAAGQACPQQGTLDQLIIAIDAAVSGPANKDRTCFRALFTPDARLIPIRVAADGTATPRILSVQDWIDAVAKRGSVMMTERQIRFKVEAWAHLAHLWSTYTTSIGTDSKDGDRGINSIQAVYDGKQWRVIEIVWQAETASDPVPAKYLP